MKKTREWVAVVVGVVAEDADDGGHGADDHQRHADGAGPFAEGEVHR